MQQQGGNPAMAGGIILIVCGLLILGGTFTKKWFGEGHGDFSFGIGLTGVEMCAEGRCESQSWTDEEMRGVKKDIIVWGYGGMLGGLASGVLSIVAGAMALARKRLPNIIGIIVYSGTALFWMLFVMRILTEGRGPKPDPSYSGAMAFLGLIGAFVVGLTMLGKKAAPAGMPMQGMPMQQPQAGVCPRCGGPVTFVAQYGRYFCQRCQQYV